MKKLRLVCASLFFILLIGTLIPQSITAHNTVLKLGMNHPEVVQLKVDLEAVGFQVSSSPTQYFGLQTEQRVREFQTAYNLTADGVAGPQTFSTLQSVIASESLYIGMSHRDVVQLKIDLDTVGFTVPGNTTTYFGSQTEEQVKKFQIEVGLQPTGIANPATLQKLEDAVSQYPTHSTFRIGDSHPQVIQLKEDLDYIGYTVSSNPTPYFGTQTETQVKAFQMGYEINADGVAGPQTFQTLANAKDSVLRIGMYHEDVVTLKNNLENAGFPVPGNQTTYFGPLTEEKVSEFQQANNIEVSGVANQPTLNELEKTGSPVPDATVLRLGDYHPKVIQLKKDLEKVGFFVSSNPTDFFGAQTERQVRAFQTAYGLTADGIAGPQTFTKLAEVIETDKIIGYVTANSSLNVRSGPSSSHSIIGSLNRGSEVEIAETVGDWYKIVYGTSYGYVHSSFISFRSPASKTIVIDAGHGGSDPGAVAFGFQEKDIVLDVAHIVNNIMEGTDIQVVLTRTGDYFIELEDRVKIAHDSGADAFVSIHANAFGQESVHGTETYWNNNHQSADSRALAEAIQERLISKLGTQDRGVKEANFHVIRHTQVPSVLVELGFITNRQEAERMQTAAFKQAAAEAIKEGVMNFYNR
ncbi:peptidoglycan-binding protein [Alteribacter aurantiacus]|uniref:peptidoglycan-binding protein n=1 Tax=Alteribacter aurantiacus TaxID=254410 RepID=UPI0003FEE6C1|nr:peptidoglycan-binding protein [Alteribacter aurantiacus]